MADVVPRRSLRSLVLAGLGPEIKNGQYLAGSLFDAAATPTPSHLALVRAANLAGLGATVGRRRVPLLRPGVGTMPHLTSLVLASILEGAGHPFEIGDTTWIWDDVPPPVAGPIDVVLLSTTFIWSRHSLDRAVAWIDRHFPSALLVCGGQYSNLKYRPILRHHPRVDLIVRGDGEAALPALLTALTRREALDAVPNLVFRTPGGRVVETGTANVDLERTQSPAPTAPTRVMPYESMRGCPFRCKFCSFPFASPEWRYKSATKIWRDWCFYADHLGTELVKAMDSTFTVPPARMEELMRLLPVRGLRWQAFSRANTIRSADYVDRLAEAGCDSLAIGFESMSETSLVNMNKKVRAVDNRRAFELLRRSAVGFKMSFMAGYPGETPDDYELTDRFLVDEFEGHFLLSVFSIEDETMPVWADADRFQLRVTDASNPDSSWQHVGMSSDTARGLVWDTLDRVRRRNDGAVVKLWQHAFDTPLLPDRDRHVNLRVEKTVERIAMVGRDVADHRGRRREIARLRAELAGLGIDDATPAAPDRLVAADAFGHRRAAHG